jgi:hypothetical protein
MLICRDDVSVQLHGRVEMMGCWRRRRVARATHLSRRLQLLVLGLRVVVVVRHDDGGPRAAAIRTAEVEEEVEVKIS